MDRIKLAKKVAESTGISQNEARLYVRVMLDCIIEGLKEDGLVTLMNFGRFSCGSYDRKGDRNFKEVVTVRFKPSRIMRYEKLMDKPYPFSPSQVRQYKETAKRKAERKKKKKPPTTIIEEA